jgi:protocatechuate 3,4-dioxygenase beta subunit
MSTFRGAHAVLAALVPMLVIACGGDDLILPSEGTAASITATRGNNQGGTVGAALAESLQVRVLDKAGRPVPNQPVAWTVVAGGGSVAPASSSTDGSGYAGASWTLGSGAGTQRVSAKPNGNGAPDNLQAVFSATAGASNAATLVKVAGDGQTAVAGSVLPDSLVVRVTDANGNPVADVPVAWSLTGGGAVSSTSLPTGADGRSAVARTLGATAGQQTTTATANGLSGSPIVFAATATVGSAGRLVITRQPSSAAASGAPFAIQPTVQVQDANGNPVALAGIAVEAAMASNPGGGALIGNTTASTNASGLATFTNLGISGPAGSYSIGFSVPNRSDISGTPPSSAIAVTAGAASKLAFSVQPSNVATGAAITPAIKVRIEDAQGTLVTSATNNVTLALSNNSTGAALSGTRTVAASGGIATFSDLSVNRPGTGYTLSASASGLSGDVSSGFNVTTGAATTIAANSSTSLSGTVGSPVTPLPSVKVTDGSGNGVSGVSVTFAVTNGGGSVSDATQTTNASGIATVGSWTLGTSAGSGNNELTATASGLSGSPVTFTASASAGSAGKLGFITQPAASGTSGQPLSQQPVLQLFDADDNPVSSGGITVTASIASGPGGSLSGASVNTTSNGRATFGNLTISGPAGTYALAFSAPSITGISSNDIVIAAGGSTKLGIVSQPSATAQSGVAFDQQPVVRLEDASGNPVAQAGVNVTVSVNESGAALGGDFTKTTDANGEATFTDLKLTGTPGSYSLLFAASGKTSVSSSDVTLGAGPVSASVSTVTASPTSFVAGAAGGSTITVTAKDQGGNAINGASVSPSATNGGTFDPASGTTGADGKATFTFTATTAGSHQVSVTVNGTELDDKPAVTVTAAAPDDARSSLSVNPTAVTTNEATTVSLTFEDQFGNPASGSVDLAVSGGSGTFGSNTVALDGSGQGSTTYTPSTEGSHTISATLGSLQEQATLTVNAAPVSGASSSIDVGTPGTLAAGQSRQVAVTARNTLNQPIAGATVSLQMTPPTGNSLIVSQVTNASGVATFTVSSTKAQGKTLVAKVNDTPVDQTGALTIVPAAPDAGKSTLTLTPAAATDGETVTVAAVFQDAFENPVADSSATFASDMGGSFTPPAGTTDATGSVSSSYTATGVGTHTLTVTTGGLPLSKTLAVSAIVPPSPDAGQSTVSADSPVAPDAPSAVTVTVRDASGNPIQGVTVTLAESEGRGTVTQPAAATDANGQAVGGFSAPSPETYTLQATAGGVTINQTAGVIVQL